MSSRDFRSLQKEVKQLKTTISAQNQTIQQFLQQRDNSTPTRTENFVQASKDSIVLLEETSIETNRPIQKEKTRPACVLELEAFASQQDIDQCKNVSCCLCMSCLFCSIIKHFYIVVAASSNIGSSNPRGGQSASSAGISSMLAPSSSTLRSLPSFSLGGRLHLLDCDSSLEELKPWDNQALLSAQEALLSQHNEHRDREQQKVNLQMDDVLANISWAEDMKRYINDRASRLHEIDAAYSEHAKQDAIIKQLVKEIHSGGKPEFFAE